MARVAVASALIPSITSGNVGKERLGDVIRLVFALLLPINMVLFFFPEPLLKMINPEYLAATNPLKTYALANTTMLMIGLIIAHIYASGNYKYTLLINTSVSTTRVTLYTILTPLYGAAGAATAYLAGTLTATALIAPKTYGIKAPWSKMILSLTIAILIGVMLKLMISLLALTTIIAIITYLTLTYLIHIALKLISKMELVQLLRMLKTIIRVR